MGQRPNVKYKIIQFLGDNIGENLTDFGFDNDFLDTTPKQINEILKKSMLYYIKLENLYSVKHTVKGIKTQTIELEKIHI